MASIAAVCRRSAYATSRYCIRAYGGQSRELSSHQPRWAASNFVMPAMSPTMTEGNIASWKVKEGDSFSAGDVLLEIETDKAQMDVEAQDDGVVAKIMEQDGAKAVKVGTRIAVFAEPGDDVASLEIPEEPNPSASQTTKSSSSSSEASKPAGPEQKDTVKKSQESQKSTNISEHDTPKQPSQPQKYPLYPSVQHLLHENNIPLSDANSIPASGPNGRLLKGDVLAYIGKISKSYSSDLASRLQKLSHLDLSNVKPAAPRKDVATATAKDGDAGAKVAKADTPKEEEALQIAVPISLKAVFATQKRIQESLGLKLPLSTFIARASEIANEGLPRPKGTAASADELFDAVLGLSNVDGLKTSRGRYTPMITVLPSVGVAPVSAPSRGSKSDIIDVLTGTKPKSRPVLPDIVSSGPAGAGMTENVFSLSVGRGEEKRARTYLERVKTVLEQEPGRCVL